MDPLTGADATAALQLYTKLGGSGMSFSGAKVAKAVRSAAGRRHLSTAISKAKSMSMRLRPVRFGRSHKSQTHVTPSTETAGRAPDDSRPRPADGGDA